MSTRSSPSRRNSPTAKNLPQPAPAVDIKIADNGIGFDPQFTDQIFVIIQRLHSRTEYEGTGIGLATCRKIVERHMGMIDANGFPGDGSTFVITLPLPQTNKEQSARCAQAFQSAFSSPKTMPTAGR